MNLSGRNNVIAEAAPPPLPNPDEEVESLIPWWAFFGTKWREDSPLIYDESDYEE